MVKIYADSTCDLGHEITEKHNIGILPLYVSLGERTGKDGMDITPDDIYEWADREKLTPKTAAFSPEDAMEEIEKCKASGDDMIFFGISEEMSASCNVVRIASKTLEYDNHVFVIDSRNLSTGIGLLVLEAVYMKEAGLNAAEIVHAVEDIIPRVRASFVVDTLTYLHRGGRCSSVTALLANTLKLKPKIVVKDGKMDVDCKYRGKQSQVVMKYVQDLYPKLMNSEERNVFITHSGIDKSIVDDVKTYLENLNHYKNIIETRAGGVVSSHCGPGTLGVLFIEK